MLSDGSNSNSMPSKGHQGIVLDYSFCNSSNLWNYLGITTIILFVFIAFSYLNYRRRRTTTSRHHKNNRDCIYVTLLILLGLFFVVPCMCWLLALVESVFTLIRYGRITASPLHILSLPIRVLAFIYMNIISGLHKYLIAPGTFIFLLFYITFKLIRYVCILAIRFGLPGFFLCAWVGFAMPLYAMIEVNNSDTWLDLAFNIQLPLFIIYKFLPLLLAVRSLILWIFLFCFFLLVYYIKFGLTVLFICKCLLIIVLVRFTYVIGKGFVVFVFFTPVTSTSSDSDDVQ